MPRTPHKQHNKKSRFLSIGSIASILMLLLITAPLMLLITISDSYALVEETEKLDSNNVIKAKQTAKQFYQELMNPASPTQRSEITISEDEINSIIALAMRGIEGLKGRMNVTPIGIKGAFTFHTPINPFGNYINLTATVSPSTQGLSINEAAIGGLELPGKLVLSSIERLLNRLLSGNATGTALVKSIESIQVKGTALSLVYHPVPDLQKIIDESKTQLKNIRDDLELLGDPAITKLYYQQLCEFHSQISGFGNVSLGYYLSSALSFAKQRTLISEMPAEENRAAILALTIFLGSTQFNSIIGAIDKETFQSCPAADKHIVLANRNDLRLHFIFSSALKIISDSGTSFAIGEFKELLDSQQGGSGFSFADLAADRAGIYFAEQALDNAGAQRIQQMASKLTDEKLFFPSISELPEGIPQHVFEARGGIEGDYYKGQLITINQRINNLSLYQQ